MARWIKRAYRHVAEWLSRKPKRPEFLNSLKPEVSSMYERFTPEQRKRLADLFAKKGRVYPTVEKGTFGRRTQQFELNVSQQQILAELLLLEVHYDFKNLNPITVGNRLAATGLGPREKAIIKLRIEALKNKLPKELRELL